MSYQQKQQVMSLPLEPPHYIIINKLNFDKYLS